MATDWAPFAPNTIGLDYWPTFVGGTSATQTRGVAITVDSTAAETIANAYVGFANSNSGVWCLDVFPQGSEVPSGLATASFVPSADEVNSANLWQNQAGSAVNIYQSIDNGVVNPASYVTYQGTFTQQGTYAFNIDTSAWPANRRVLKMTFSFTAAATASSVGRLQVIYRSGATNSILGQVTLTGTTETFSFDVGELNPGTGLPWTETAVEALATTAGFGWKALSGRTTEMQVYDASVTITYVTENRVAAGVKFVDQSSISDFPAWQTIGLINPNTGAANWSKANATTYTVLLRPLSPVGSAGIFVVGQGSAQTFDSGAPLPTGAIGYRPFVDDTGAVTSVGDDQTFGMTLALDVNASATDSADGMPYIDRVAGTATPPAGQTVSGATSATYELMTMMLLVADGADPSEVVTWQILAPGPTVVDSGTLTVAEILDGESLSFTVPSSPAAPDVPVRRVSVPISATLAAATTYTVTLDDTSAPNVYVVSLKTSDFNGSGGIGDPATYGGVTLDYNSNDAEDWPVTLSTVPDPVTEFGSYIAYTTTDQIGCNPEQVPYTVLGWQPTSLGADFGYYQIERSTDGGDWEQIGQITTEAVDQYQDHEAAFVHTIVYRIRVVRTGDLIPSAWAEHEAAVLDPPACTLYLSSNLRPDGTLAYNGGPTITWQWPSANDATWANRAGADYMQALVPSEWRGDRWDSDLVIWQATQNSAGQEPPGGVGRAAFDELLALTRAPLPYICVRDQTGRVWYCSVIPQEGTRSETDQQNEHVAAVSFQEITNTPSIIDVSIDTSVVFLDEFNRANTADIDGSTPNIGPVWQTFNTTGGAIGIQNNRAYTSTVDAAANFAYADVGLTDGWLQSEYTYAPVASGETVSPVVWRANLGVFDGWQVGVVDATGNRLVVQRLDLGFPTTYYDQPVPFVTGQTYLIRVEFQGAYHRISIDGETICQVISDVHASDTEIGFVLNSADNYIDRIEAGTWPAGTTALDIEESAAVWLDARSIDISWVAADNWTNLGTLGAAQDATTAVGGPNDLNPPFVEAGEPDGPGFDASDTAPIGSDARCFTIAYNAIQTIPELAGGRSFTFYVTPSVTFESFNKLGWTYSGPNLHDSENGWVIEDVPAVGPPGGPVIFGAASPGPVVVGVTDDPSIPGPQVWTVVCDRGPQTMELWRNGILLSTASMATLGDSDSASELEIGRNFSFHAHLIHGEALTAAEVVALHTSLTDGPAFASPEPSYDPSIYQP